MQVEAKEALPAGSPEEVEIRACTIVAVERLKAALASAVPPGMSFGWRSSPSCLAPAAGCQAGGVGGDMAPMQCVPAECCSCETTHCWSMVTEAA